MLSTHTYTLIFSADGVPIPKQSALFLSQNIDKTLQISHMNYDKTLSLIGNVAC